MSSLSGSSAVRTARQMLAEYEAGGTAEWPAAPDSAYWFGAIRHALRIVLDEIGPEDAPGGAS